MRYKLVPDKIRQFAAEISVDKLALLFHTLITICQSLPKEFRTSHEMFGSSTATYLSNLCCQSLSERKNSSYENWLPLLCQVYRVKEVHNSIRMFLWSILEVCICMQHLIQIIDLSSPRWRDPSF